MIGLLAATPLLPSSIKALINEPQITDTYLSNPKPEEPDPMCSTADDPLEEWRLRPRYPIAESDSPVVQRLLRATRTGERITFLYEGGSSPGSTRIATVECIFRHKNSPLLYMAAYCHLRGSHRIFRTDRLEII